MNTSTLHHPDGLPPSQPFPPAPRRMPPGCRRWRAVLRGWLLLCMAAVGAYGQIPAYGPPKVASSGSLLPFTTTTSVPTDVWLNPNTSQSQELGTGDYYSDTVNDVFVGAGVFTRVSGGAWTRVGTYDGTAYRFFDPNGGVLSGLAPVDATENFFGLEAGVTAIVGNEIGAVQLILWSDMVTLRAADYWFQRSSGGPWVAKFIGVPNGTIQAAQAGTSAHCSPPYQYQGGELTLDRTLADGWPVTNLFNVNAPPATMVVNGQSYGLLSAVRTSWQGGYTEEVTYQFSQVSQDQQAGFHRSVTLEPDGSVSSTGDVWASSGGAVQFTGSLNPTTMAVSGVGSSGGVPGSISFSAPDGTAAQGPAWISWGADTLPFAYHANDGSDVYWDLGSGKFAVVQPEGAGGLCPVSAFTMSFNSWTGSYNPATGAFFGGDGSPLLAIDSNGNLLGTPAGVVAFFSFSAAISGASLRSADGSTLPPTYTWQTPGRWGVKFVNVPARPFVVVPGMGSPSLVYRWSGASNGDMIVGTSSEGWLPSNIHPQTIYVNAVACSKFVSEDFPELLDATFPNGSGTATYRSADGNRAVTLAWNGGNPITAWTGTWTYADNLNGSDSGAWDGGDVFSVGTSASTVLSLAPAPTAPRHGPGQIAWDGTILGFDSVASFMAGGKDVYRDETGNVRAQVGADGSVQLNNYATGISALGTYNAGTNRFDFGTSFTGVVQGMGAGESLTGDLILAGSLDVHGSTFNFATDGGNLNMPAFAWLHRGGPIIPGAPSGNHLRWLTASSLYEWTWEAPIAPGHYSPLMALRSHPFPTLAVSVPITNPAGPVVIGRYPDTSPDAASGTDRTKGVLVIAAGTKDATNGITPRNALRVLDDGTVLIRPGGDILMGEFTAGPRP